MSRLNQQNSLNYGNKETHIFTEFGTLSKESTQKEVLDAIKNINLNVGEIVVGDITVESSDTVTHTKLDTLNTTVINKHLSSTTDSVNVGNFPATQVISGSVNVGNFPATQPVSGTVAVSSLPAIAITNTSFNVGNFPATQAVSGSVNVGNFPATQPISGSVNVSNTSLAVTGDFYPATQPISGAVSVSNFPATQAVSGSVNATVSNFPATQAISGAVSVSNFPATQPISGSVNISNTSLAVTGDFYPATQPISGSVNVGNFPTTQAVSGSVNVGNFPATQAVSGSVNVSNTSLAVTGDFYPATQPISGSVNVSNTSLAVTGDFYPATQPISGAVSVSNFPATQPISGSVNATVSNFPATQAISGAVNVSNFPTTQPISGSVNISNTSLAVTGDFYPATQPISGSVNVGNFPTTQAVSGSVNVGNFPTTQAVSGSVNVGNFPATQPISGTVTVGNTSLDTHCYGSSNGTTWHHLATDSNGQLNVHSKTQDGAGTDITSTTISTKQALDVNVAGGSISISSVNIKDSNGNNLQAVSNVLPQLKTTLYDEGGNVLGTSTANPIKAQIVNTSAVPVSMSGLTSSVVIGDGVNNANIKRLDSSDTITSTYGVVSKSVVCGVVSGTANPVGMTIGSALKVNVENTSVPVSGSVSISGTPSVDATIIGTPSVNATIVGTPTVSTTISGATSSIQIGNGTTNATVTGTIANIKTSNALVCDSALYGLNSSTGDMQPLTVNLNGSRNQLETRDNDANTTLSAINTKTVQQYNTTNDASVIGLNVMQIRPKVRVYNIMGNSSVADFNMMMMAPGGSRYYFNDSFGIANTKNWYAYSSTARTINYEYVDNTGAIGNHSVVLPVNTWTLMNKEGNVAGTFLVNKWTTTSINSPNNVYISYLSSNNGGSAFGGNSGGNFNSIFTVPTGYVATISNITFYSQISDYPAILKWDAQGNRSVVYYWITNTQFFTETYSNPYCGVGGIFTAGETIGFCTFGNSSSKQLCATITCMPV